MTSTEYKDLSVREFTKAAEIYESDNAGVYNMCRKDYPDVLAELEKEPFTDLLDCGCGTGPMLTLLHEKYPEKHYTGIDLTPKMIEVAKRKNMKGVELVVGDCENLPFEENSFDVVICCESFHHYPDPQKFFNSVYRVLRPDGRLILRDMTMSSSAVRWLCNHIEMPLAHLAGKGDVRIYGREDIKELCGNAGLYMESFEKRDFCRLHCVARKRKNAVKRYNNIASSYKRSRNIYDDVLTQNKWWSKLYIRLFWSGADDNMIAERLLSHIPDDFSGKLLDVPVGTGVFTHKKYDVLKNADITCLDYSADMLEQACERLKAQKNITLVQGDVGKLPYEKGEFDVVLSMNGFHAFPDKKAAFCETFRVLKKGGKFIACFYVKGRSRVTDCLVKNFLVKKGWFTPPFDTVQTLKKRLEKVYDIEEFKAEGSIVYFCAVKK
ncbi:class I SAM-dependent methyltransferase [Ruminococcus sp.]|uniref:class I SAM-dependent methyltransferase n=1 Tax=Ruminococcus sp. TaxID=41978 RepID=UPI00345D0867